VAPPKWVFEDADEACGERKSETLRSGLAPRREIQRVITFPDFAVHGMVDVMRIVAILAKRHPNGDRCNVHHFAHVDVQ
jgi:hypothetical protein